MPAARPTRPPQRFGCRCCRSRSRPRREADPSYTAASRQSTPPPPARPEPAAAARRRRKGKRAETSRSPSARRAGDRQRRLSRVRPLPNPTNDARAIARSLRALGFVVTKAPTSTARRCARCSATSCAMPRGRKWRCCIMPATACRSTAAISWCRSISSSRGRRPAGGDDGHGSTWPASTTRSAPTS